MQWLIITELFQSNQSDHDMSQTPDDGWNNGLPHWIGSFCCSFSPKINNADIIFYENVIKSSDISREMFNLRGNFTQKEILSQIYLSKLHATTIIWVCRLGELFLEQWWIIDLIALNIYAFYHSASALSHVLPQSNSELNECPE